MTTTAIFVLGMHRSGTSATAATLGLLGANLGGHLIPGREDNKKGFFEDGRCVNTNIKLLRCFGTDGHGGVALPGNWRDLSETQSFFPKMQAILADLGTQPIYAIKDPRLSLVAEMWFDAAMSLGHEVKVVIAGRHPLQVAQSLERRDNVTRYRAYLTWLLYTVRAVQCARDFSRTYIAFEDLQTAVDACIVRMVELVGRPDIFFVDDERRAKINEFLDPSMINNRETTDNQFANLSKELSALYAAMSTGDEAYFNQCLQRGALRMFMEMTAAYRGFLASQVAHRNLVDFSSADQSDEG